MDAIIAIDCIPAFTKDLSRFEQRGMDAEKVRNASRVGRQFWANNAQLGSWPKVPFSEVVDFLTESSAIRKLSFIRTGRSIHLRRAQTKRITAKGIRFKPTTPSTRTMHAIPTTAGSPRQPKHFAAIGGALCANKRN
jgi:hypothetical protein